MATLNPAKSHGYYSAKDQQYHTAGNDLYMNDNAISNAIHYVTRTGKRTDRADELIAWGTVGCCVLLSPDECITQFEQVQKLVRRGRDVGTKIVHEILTFSDDEANHLLHNKQSLLNLAHFAASIYYRDGYQCVYGIHHGIHCDDNDLDASVKCEKLHMHFIVNAVNFVTGNKFATKLGSKVFSLNEETFFKIPYDTKERERNINAELYGNIMQVYNPYQSVSADYISNAYALYPKRM